MAKTEKEEIVTPESVVEVVTKEVDTEEKPKEDRMVEVPAMMLEKMLSRMDRLEYAASKAQLSHFDSKIKQDKTKRANLSTFNGKIVVAWKILDNIVEQVNGAWIEKQNIEIIYRDGTKDEMACKKFWLSAIKIPVEVQSEKILKNGQVVWEVETIPVGMDDKVIKLEIDTTFIN